MGLGLPFWGHSLTSSESNQVHRFFSIVFRIIIAVDTEISCIIIYMIDSKLISFHTVGYHMIEQFGRLKDGNSIKSPAQDFIIQLL